MGVFDLPLNELKVYKGSSPCPEDFDEFWDKSVKEAKSLEWNLKLEKSRFQTNFAECFDLFFTGVGGAKIHAKYVLSLIHISEPTRP